MFEFLFYWSLPIFWSGYFASLFCRFDLFQGLLNGASRPPLHPSLSAAPCWSPLIPAFYHSISALPGRTHTQFPTHLIYCISCAYLNILVVGADAGFTYSLIFLSCADTHTHTLYTQQAQSFKVTLTVSIAATLISLIHHPNHSPSLLQFNLII